MMSDEFAVFVLELLAPMNGVSSRKMFGGHGVFKDGLMFGLIADDVLYLKVDEQNSPQFEAEGLPHFTYVKNGKPMNMSYRQAPEAAMEEAELLCEWAESAWQAAVRAKR